MQGDPFEKGNALKDKNFSKLWFHFLWIAVVFLTIILGALWLMRRVMSFRKAAYADLRHLPRRSVLLFTASISNRRRAGLCTCRLRVGLGATSWEDESSGQSENSPLQGGQKCD